jgi:hypothetical protein
VADVTLSTVGAEGDRVATLRRLRDRLCDQIDRTDSSRDLASLARQLTDVLRQIDAAGRESPDEDRTFDELARRRSARGGVDDSEFLRRRL